MRFLTQVEFGLQIGTWVNVTFAGNMSKAAEYLGVPREHLRRVIAGQAHPSKPLLANINSRVFYSWEE